MSTETITILAGRLGEARERIAKFERKAKRYNVPFHVVFGDVYKQTRKEQTDNMWYPGGVRTYEVNVVDVTIEGETPKVGDYEFVASIEFTDGGNFIDCAPGHKALKAWRETDQRCEHCNASRRRKHVYMVRNINTGSFTQVGRTCLRDFLGIDDPKWIIQRFKFWREFRGDDDERGFSGFGQPKWSEDIRFLLAATNACIRIWGWASKGMARQDESLTATMGRIWALYGSDKYSREEAAQIRAEMRDSDRELADEVVDWVRASTDDNDYMHNLRVAFADDLLLDQRRTGLAISAVSAWHRAQERELKMAKRQEQDAQSEHIGNLLTRLRGLKVRLEDRRSMGDRGYGETSLLKFRDEAGNIFSWFTGSYPNVDVGEDVVIDGTVKRHTEFRGVKETQLTRVKVLEEGLQA